MSGVLLTGATGLVGRATLVRLLAHDPRTVVHCLVRADDDEHLAARRDQLIASAGVAPADAGRVVAVPGDVEQPMLGIPEPHALAPRIDVVLHAAASTRFDLTIEAARAVNVGAASHVVDFASLADDAGGLRCLHHVSTAFVAGDADGVVADPPLHPLGPFRNTYEQSKWEAEQVIREAGASLPTTISRPSIVVGDSTTGATPHFRVLYEPMKWVYFHSRSDGASYSDRLSNVLPCRPEIRLDVVPVDFVADALVALTSSEAARGGTFHVSAGPDRSLTIADSVDLMLTAGNRDLGASGRPPVERPVLVSPEMLEGSEELRQLFAMGEELMSAYMPYALRETLFDPAGLHELLGGALGTCPNPRDYYPVLVEYANTHNYGRAPR